jgi:1,4-dihydroxy-2-naphthoate octaprenyltransferase
MLLLKVFLFFSEMTWQKWALLIIIAMGLWVAYLMYTAPEIKYGD